VNTRSPKQQPQNQFLELYRKVFGGQESDVRVGIQNIQAAARQYVDGEADGKVVTFASRSLDREIEKAYGLKMKLTPEEREALVHMLVSYHDLRIIKPWNDPPGPTMW
jgi:hypothetical protein